VCRCVCVCSVCVYARVHVHMHIVCVYACVRTLLIADDIVHEQFLKHSLYPHGTTYHQYAYQVPPS